MESPTTPELESAMPQATGREAGAGWLLWLSCCAAFTFSLVLISGEVDRRVAAGGLVLSLVLLLYETRRLRNARQWVAGLGPGCAGGVLFSGALAAALDRSGLVEIWDKRDQGTPLGMLLLWIFMVAGMAMVARWNAHAAERLAREKAASE